MRRTSMNLGLVMILLAGISFGTIPVFTTPLAASGVNAEVQVAWRVAVGAPVLLLSAFLVERREKRPGKYGDVRLGDLPAFLGIGGVLLMLFLTYVGSLSLGTPAATAVLLLYSQPIFTVLLSRAFLKDPEERITRTRLIALILGISGVLVVLNPLGLGMGVELGQALALSSGFFYTVYIISSKKINRFRPVTKTSLSFGGALLLLLLFGLLIQVFFVHSAVFAGIVALNAVQAALILGLVALGTIFPYLALNFGLERMAASDAGMTLLVEPVSASALGFLILGQSLGPGQVVGGILIITSIVVLHLYHQK